MAIKMYLLIFAIPVAGCSVCPNETENGTPSVFGGNEGELLFSRIGHYAELTCCMAGIDFVVWSKYDYSTKTWRTLPTEDDNYILQERGQVLSIKSAMLDDGGDYKCSAQKNGAILKNVSRKLDLEVAACDTLARGPYHVTPLACQKTVTKVGESLVLPCAGYFGCWDDVPERLVSWYVSHDVDGHENWKPASQYSDRYSQKEFTSDNIVLGANLTITEVASEDFSRKFMCLLASPQMIHGQTNYVVELVDSAPRETVLLKSGFDDPHSLLLTVTGVLGILILVVSLTTLCIITRRSRQSQKVAKTSFNHGSPIFHPVRQCDVV